MTSLEIRNIGYLLHPSVTDKLPHSPTIADIGTGTGLFLSKLAEIYPEATLRGFDISQELFPTPGSLPSNVSLNAMDVKQPPPREEENKYDVVHVRLLTAAMNPADWELAVHNLRRLLKPGGALQWEECNFAGAQHLRGRNETSATVIRFMGSRFREGLKEKLADGWSTIPRIMKDAGLLCLDEDIVSSDRVVETREALTRNGTVAMFGREKLMVERGIASALSLEELKKLQHQTHKDIESGCYVRYDVHIAVGFKPE